MKSLLLVTGLLAAPLTNALALEAVAQGGVGSGSAAAARNVALESKVQTLQTQGNAHAQVITEMKGDLSDLKEELQTIKQGSSSASIIIPSCEADEYVWADGISFSCKSFPQDPCEKAVGTVIKFVHTRGKPGSCGYTTTAGYCTANEEGEFKPACHSYHQVTGSCKFGVNCPSWVVGKVMPDGKTCSIGGQRCITSECGGGGGVCP